MNVYVIVFTLHYASTLQSREGFCVYVHLTLLSLSANHLLSRHAHTFSPCRIFAGTDAGPPHILCTYRVEHAEPMYIFVCCLLIFAAPTVCAPQEGCALQARDNNAPAPRCVIHFRWCVCACVLLCVSSCARATLPPLDPGNNCN